MPDGSNSGITAGVAESSPLYGKIPQIHALYVIIILKRPHSQRSKMQDGNSIIHAGTDRTRVGTRIQPLPYEGTDLGSGVGCIRVAQR